MLNTADQLSKTESQAVAGSTEQANASVRAPGVLAPLGRGVPRGGSATNFITWTRQSPPNRFLLSANAPANEPTRLRLGLQAMKKILSLALVAMPSLALATPVSAGRGLGGGGHGGLRGGVVVDSITTASSAAPRQ